MSLNAQSGIFTIEVLTFLGVAGYAVYKWNTTPSLGDELGSGFSAIGEGLSDAATATSNWFGQEFGNLGSGQTTFPDPASGGWGQYGPSQQTSLALLPGVEASHPGSYNPPPLITTPFGGWTESSPGQTRPGETQTFQPLGVVGGAPETYSGPVPNEAAIATQIAAYTAAQTGSNGASVNPTNPNVPVISPSAGLTVDPPPQVPGQRPGGRNRQWNGFAY